MALLALSKGQLLISIYKMYKENDMLSLYDKKLLKYSVDELASEYVKIENTIKKNKILEMSNYDVNPMANFRNYSSGDSSSDSDDNFMKNATMKNPNRLNRQPQEG